MYAENLVRKVLKVTVDQVMSWEPCEEYTRERVEELFAGRESLSALEIMKLDIPAKDMLWAVLCEELVPAETLHEFGCRCNAAWDAADAAWDAADAARSAQVAILQTLLREAENA